MCLTEYDEAKTLSIIAEEAKAEGIKEGMEKGIEKGMEKGKKQGILEMLVELVKEKTLQIPEAAKKANMSVSEFEKLLKA